jgi:hypothetical protein
MVRSKILGGDLDSNFLQHYAVDVHSLGAEFPIHKNYAGIGYTLGRRRFCAATAISILDFIDEETYLWQAPTPMPTDGKIYRWDEANLAWEAV